MPLFARETTILEEVLSFLFFTPIGAAILVAGGIFGLPYVWRFSRTYFQKFWAFETRPSPVVIVDGNGKPIPTDALYHRDARVGQSSLSQQQQQRPDGDMAEDGGAVSPNAGESRFSGSARRG